jgi:hypothetical protein
VLWHADLGGAPRYGTARCAAFMRDLLSNADWRASVAEALPPDGHEALCQPSYPDFVLTGPWWAPNRWLVGDTGLEPVTSCMSSISV